MNQKHNLLIDSLLKEKSLDHKYEKNGHKLICKNKKFNYKSIIAILFLIILPYLIRWFVFPKMTLASNQELIEISRILNIFCFGFAFFLPLFIFLNQLSIVFDFSREEIINTTILKQKKSFFKEISNYEINSFKRRFVSYHYINLKTRDGKSIRIGNISGVKKAVAEKFAKKVIINLHEIKGGNNI